MDIKSIDLRLARATTVPIFPNAVIQVLALADDPHAGAREYERIIQLDTGLTAKILRTANSTYFGGGGHITNLQRALTQIGVSAIRSICLAVAFQSALQVKALDKRFNVAAFWQHSLGVACAAKLIAGLAQRSLAEEAFIAGMLHDVGKLALCMFMPLEAGRILDMMEAEHISQFEAEMGFLGVSHQDIGRIAAERWGLPEVYHAPIAKHHTPTEDVYEIDARTAYVHVANALVHEIGLGITPHDMKCEVDPIVADFVGLSDAQYQPIRNCVAMEVSRMSSQMGL